MIKGLKPISVAAVAFALSFTGCGGGGGSSSSVAKSEVIEGSVQASRLGGVKVCVANTNECSVTNSKGEFKLHTSYPVTLEVKVGDTKIGEVKASNKYVNITPGTLSKDSVIAGYLGALLHKAGGCAVTSSYCDLSKVKNIEIGLNTKDLVSGIKSAIKNGTLYAKVNDKSISVSKIDMDEYILSNPIISGKGEITYQGVMTLGDYAEFTFDLKNEKVDYSIKGNVLGKVASSSKIYNMYNNMLFVNSDASNFYYLTAGIMFSTVMENGKPYTVIGIPKNLIAVNKEDIANKKFNILIKDAKINDELVTSVARLQLNKDNTFKFLTKDLFGNSINVEGTWSVSDNKVYLKDDKGNNFIILAVKKGKEQSVVIADFVNGGFGLGIESVPMNARDMSKYKYIKFVQDVGDNQDEICLGALKVAKQNSTQAKIYETDIKCFVVHKNANVNAVFFEEVLPQKPVSYTILYDPSLEIDGEDITFNSIGVSFGDVNSVSIIDGSNGVFAQVGMRDNKEVAILGSNKFLH